MLSEDIILEISAVVVSYNTKAMTLHCLDVLLTELQGIRSELWVVDNASRDGSAEAVRQRFPSIKLIANASNCGFGAANNQAIRQGRSEFILLLNTDAFPKPGAIRAMLNRMREESGIAVIGPRLVNVDGSLQKSCYKFPGPGRAVCEHLLLTAAFPNHPKLGDLRGWPHDSRREVAFVIGACMLVRRAAIAEVGMFDESFFFYGEETDWCYRFWKAGWKVEFCPDAQVTHLGGESGSEQPGKVFCEFRRANERFVTKHYGLVGLWIVRSMLIVGACIRITIFGLSGVLRPRRRAARFKVVNLWTRILMWNLGFRGPGLSDV